MRIHHLTFVALLTLVAATNGLSQSGVELIQRWADAWAEVPGSRWTWEFEVEVRGTDRTLPRREEVAIYSMDAFVRSSTTEVIVGKGPTTDVNGYDENGRFYSLPGHSNTFTGGNVVVDRVGLLRASAAYAPSAFAHMINSGTLAVERDEVSTDGERTIWKPSYFEGEYRLVFADWHGMPVLHAIEWLDKAGSLRSRNEFVYDGGEKHNGVAIPAERHYVSYPMDVRLPHPNDPTKFIEFNETVKRTERLISFEVLDASEKPYVDPTGRQRYDEKKQAFFDPEGSMIFPAVTSRCGRSAAPDTALPESPGRRP